MMMSIENYKSLKKILDLEFKLYFKNNKHYYRHCILRTKEYRIWNYQKALRYLELYKNRIMNGSGIYSKLLFLYYSRKVNQLGLQLGIDTWCNVFGEGLRIYHAAGGIVVNSEARVGKNCHLHGNNCIGNNGKAGGKSPIIGDNCILGVGAKVLGDIRLANNIKIAAGAVVIKSCMEEGVTLAGVPAKVVESRL